jgi:hypothetical protein
MDDSYIVKGIATGVISYVVALHFGIWIGVATFLFCFLIYKNE